MQRKYLRECLYSPFIPQVLFTALCLFISQSLWAEAQSSKTYLQALKNSKSISNTNKDIVPGELLVKLRKNSAGVRQKPSRYKPRLKSRLQSLGIEHWKLEADQDINEAIAALRADPAVEIVEPNIRRYPRASANESDNINSIARLQQVKLDELWNIPVVSERLSNKVRVAVIDDAFNVNHDDLNANIVDAYDAVTGDNDPSPETCRDVSSGEEFLENHGTQVLGVLGAVSNNGIGINGAADNAEIIPIRIGCNYTLAAELRAFEYAVSKNVDIISVSWGGALYSELERQAIYELQQKDILVVVAAGNYHSNNDRVPDYPSGIDLPNILVVAATDVVNNLTDWSQYGPTSVDIAAPGVSFDTTHLANSYTIVSGTSFSTPLVAGIAASLMARVSNVSVFDVKAALMASANPFANELRSRLVTDGFVNAIDAFDILNGNAKPVPVIKNVTIEDFFVGNANGEVDPGDSIALNIEIENLGIGAESLSTVLTTSDSQVFIFSAPESDTSLAGYDADNFVYGTIKKRFSMDFGNSLTRQDIPFSLVLSGTYNGGRSFSYTRYFTIDTGSLENNIPINAEIRKFGDDQDEIHYYHIDLEQDEAYLNVALSSNGNLDLLVKKGNAPQFDYQTYWDYDSIDGVDEDTEVSANDIDLRFGEENIQIRNPGSGTYHIVVLVSEHDKKNNISYTLVASVSPKKYSDCASGCGSFGAMINTTLAFLFLPLLIWRIKPFLLLNKNQSIRSCRMPGLVFKVLRAWERAHQVPWMVRTSLKTRSGIRQL